VTPDPLSLAFFLLLVTALLGTGLSAMHLGASTRTPSWFYGALHGVLGVGGFAALLVALDGPPRGAATGVAGFGRFAAALFAATLLLALIIVAAHVRRRRLPALVIGMHATAAVAGLAILAAYTLMG